MAAEALAGTEATGAAGAAGSASSGAESVASRTRTVSAKGQLGAAYPGTKPRKQAARKPAPKPTEPAPEPEKAPEAPEPHEEPGSAPDRSLSLPSGGGDIAAYLLAFMAWVWVGAPLLRGGPTEVRKVWYAKWLNRTPDGKALP